MDSGESISSCYNMSFNELSTSYVTTPQAGVFCGKMVTPKSSECDKWPPLSPEEINQRRDSVKLWTIVPPEGESPAKLQREFVCKNFVAALDFITAAGAIAEERGHHPDFHLTGYRNVRVVVYSHGVSALTDNDFNLCVQIDGDVKISYSPKFLKENPHIAATAK